MLTQDEAELYDRQIRLWGVSAQSRLRQSKVLMLGFNGVASEVAKILVLAGIDTLTIVDDQTLQEHDHTSNLFCRPSEANTQFRTNQVKEKLRILNPLVKVNIENVPILSKAQEEFKQYDLVALNSFMSFKHIGQINKHCRDNNIRFYLVLDYGFFGFMFNDLGPKFRFTYEEFDKISEQKQSSGKEKDPINFDEESDDGMQDDDRAKKRRRHDSPNEKKHIVEELPYVPFSDMISMVDTSFDKKTSPVLFISIAMLKFFDEHGRLPDLRTSEANNDDITQADEDLEKLNQYIEQSKKDYNVPESIFKKLDPDWTKNLVGSFSPVCAIVGAAAGQDMIRSLSNRDIPICNTFSFDGIDMSGVVERIGMKNEKLANSTPVIRDFLEID